MRNYGINKSIAFLLLRHFFPPIFFNSIFIQEKRTFWGLELEVVLCCWPCTNRGCMQYSTRLNPSAILSLARMRTIDGAHIWVDRNSWPIVVSWAHTDVIFSCLFMQEHALFVRNIFDWFYSIWLNTRLCPNSTPISNIRCQFLPAQYVYLGTTNSLIRRLHM